MHAQSPNPEPPPGVIAGGYLADILDQPRALAATVQSLRAPAELESLAARLNRGEFRRVILTGMGSSLHALHPLHIALAAHGCAAILAETSELLFALAPLLRSDALLVVVSQSGASVEIIRLLGELPPGAAVIAVTNTPDSPLARRANAVLLTRAGTETTVSCKTYLAALALLDWLAVVLCGQARDVAASELAQAGPAVAACLSDWRNHVATLRNTMRDVQDVFLVGRGASLAAAGVGGLIIKESAHVHAEGLSSAAFRHGPFEMVSARSFVGVFRGDDSVAALNERLCADVQRAGGRAAMIGEGARDPALAWPAAPRRLQAILEMLPVEMISLALAANQGREAGRFERATKVTTIE